MEERSLRDVERWKDKIEVRLDNRQVFFLFFGSALTACLLFVLGVIVGKRLESRGRAAVTPELEDPLALLDRVAATPAAAPEPVAAPPRPVAAKAPERAARPVPAAPDKKAPPAAAAEPKPAEKPKAVVVDKPAPKPEPETKPAPPAVNAAKARFTLQLSSFQDRAEAEAFAKRFEFASPYIITSTLPGKGTWYRVRAGDYGSAKEAAAAKDAFEKQHNTIAYVAPR